MNADELRSAVDAATEVEGYPWTVGVLEGALRHGWSPAQTAAFLRDSIARSERVS